MDTRYPYYCTDASDQALMHRECRIELEAWRLAVAYRLRLPVMQRSAYWMTLAQAFDELRIAFGRAKRPIRKAA